MKRTTATILAIACITLSPRAHADYGFYPHGVGLSASNHDPSTSYDLLFNNSSNVPEMAQFSSGSHVCTLNLTSLAAPTGTVIGHPHGYHQAVTVSGTTWTNLYLVPTVDSDGNTQFETMRQADDTDDTNDCDYTDLEESWHILSTVSSKTHHCIHSGPALTYNSSFGYVVLALDGGGTADSCLDTDTMGIWTSSDAGATWSSEATLTLDHYTDEFFDSDFAAANYGGDLEAVAITYDSSDSKYYLRRQEYTTAWAADWERVDFPAGHPFATGPAAVGGEVGGTDSLVVAYTDQSHNVMVNIYQGSWGGWTNVGDPGDDSPVGPALGFDKTWGTGGSLQVATTIDVSGNYQDYTSIYSGSSWGEFSFVYTIP